MTEPIEMTAVRNRAAMQDAGPGSGVQESRAIVTYVDGLLLELGNARAFVERARSREDVVRREAAESKQIRVSADNVAYNAEQRLLVYWRDAFNARSFVKRLLDIAEAEPTGHRYTQEEVNVITTARKWFDGEPPRDPNAPEPEKLDTT